MSITPSSSPVSPATPCLDDLGSSTFRMGFVQISSVALALVVAAKAAYGAPSLFCDPATDVCYSGSTVGIAEIAYRVALPVVDTAPFDMLIQIVAPKSAGWAGIAWGGHMINNTVTLGWANGNSSVVSSRWAR